MKIRKEKIKILCSWWGNLKEFINCLSNKNIGLIFKFNGFFICGI